VNYQEHYNRLINRARNRILDEYTEVHHILPRCLGGDNTKENLVRLTPEEHYVAHQLLVRINPNHYGLVYAALLMCANRKGRNKLYGWLKRKYAKNQSINQSGNKNSQFGTMWITNGVNSKKIKINDPIPKGWHIGRVIKVPKAPKEKIKHGIESDKYSWIINSEEEIINEFKTHKSISRILHKRGFYGREGNLILSSWLKSKGLQPLKRRNSKMPASHSG